MIFGSIIGFVTFIATFIIDLLPNADSSVVSSIAAFSTDFRKIHRRSKLLSNPKRYGRW